MIIQFWSLCTDERRIGLDYDVLLTCWLGCHKYGYSELLQVIITILNIHIFHNAKIWFCFDPENATARAWQGWACQRETANQSLISSLVLICFFRNVLIKRCQQRRNQSVTPVTTRWNEQRPKYLHRGQGIWSAAVKLVQRTTILAARKWQRVTVFGTGLYEIRVKAGPISKRVNWKVKNSSASQLAGAI